MKNDPWTMSESLFTEPDLLKQVSELFMPEIDKNNENVSKFRELYEAKYSEIPDEEKENYISPKEGDKTLLCLMLNVHLKYVDSLHPELHPSL